MESKTVQIRNQEGPNNDQQGKARSGARMEGKEMERHETRSRSPLRIIEKVHMTRSMRRSMSRSRRAGVTPSGKGSPIRSLRSPSRSRRSPSRSNKSPSRSNRSPSRSNRSPSMSSKSPSRSMWSPSRSRSPSRYHVLKNRSRRSPFRSRLSPSSHREASRTRDGRDGSFKTPSSSQFLPRMRFEKEGKQQAESDFEKLRIELMQARVTTTEHYNKQKQWEDYARAQNERKEHLQRIVTTLESTVNDQKNDIEALEKSKDKQNKMVADLSDKFNDRKKGTVYKLKTQELEIERLNKLSEKQVEEIIGLKNTNIFWKKEVGELLTSVKNKEKIIIAKSMEIDDKEKDTMHSIGRNQDLCEQNKYLKDYIEMKDKEIAFLKFNRKDLSASDLIVEVDQDVVEPLQLPRIRCVDSAELLIISEDNGGQMDNIAQADVETGLAVGGISQEGNLVA